MRCVFGKWTAVTVEIKHAYTHYRLKLNLNGNPPKNFQISVLGRGCPNPL